MFFKIGRFFSFRVVLLMGPELWLNLYIDHSETYKNNALFYAEHLKHKITKSTITTITSEIDVFKVEPGG